MSKIFLSYGRAEVEIARQIVHALEKKGFSVFWDRTIAGGETWAEKIERQLEQSDCVIVIWSTQSVESNWVIEEAGYGLEQNKLLPILVDDVKPPLGFGRFQTFDLRGWNGDPEDDRFQIIVDGIRHVANRT